MLTVCVNLTLQLLRKVKQKSQVLRYLNILCAITLLCCMMSGSVLAYTVSTSGTTSVYNWELPTISYVQSYIHPDIIPAPQVTMGYRASYNGQNVRYGVELPGTSNTSNRVGYIDASDGILPRISIYSTGIPNTQTYAGSTYYISNVAQVGLRSESSEVLTLTDSYYSFDVEFNTIFDFYSNDKLGSTYEERLETFIDICRIYLIDSSNSVVVTLHPSDVSTELRQTKIVHGDDFANSEGEYQDYYFTKVKFLMENNVDELEIQDIQLIIPVSCGTTYNTGMYWRQDVSFSSLTMTVLSTQNFYAQQNAIFQNDNLISQLGTINSVDQATINSQKTEFDKVSVQTSQLAGASEFTEGLLSDFDVKQDVDILSDTDYISSVRNAWEVFPMNKPFFVTAITMIGSISLLSLILHAGERSASIFASDRHGDKTWQRHRDMAKKQNQSNGKSGGK